MDFVGKKNQPGRVRAFFTSISLPLIVGALLSQLFLSQLLAAQNAATAANGSVSGAIPATAVQVPRLIRLSGTLTPPSPSGSSVVNVTFSLYAEETGGTALWQESQNVELDSTGHYTVLLGSTQAEGLPVELFTSNAAQWLGLRPAGEAEQSRIMLVSVPFALKAGDAETLGGKPASAYVTAPPPGATTGTNASATGQVAGVSKPAGANASTPNDSHPVSDVTGSGTKDYVPLWTSSSKLGSSALYENTTNSYIGIGTTAPVSTFNVQVTSSATEPAIEASSAATGQAAILGTNTSTETGTTPGSGVYGTVVSPAAWGVWGANSATSDTYGGVYGTSASPSGIGVEGLDSDTTGSGSGGVGVLGTTSSPNGFGVEGKATDTSGTSYGVYGISAGSDGYGVFGTSTNSSGGYGVFGSSTAGTGVYGTSPVGPGVWGQTSSIGLYATAVYGLASADTGETYGVSGETSSAEQGAAGVNGYSGAGTGVAPGVQGDTWSATPGAAGVYGYEGATSGGVAGVYGYTASIGEEGSSAAAVYGDESGGTGVVYGVSGWTASVTTGAAAVYGFEGATTGAGAVVGVSGGTASAGTASAGVLGFEEATSGTVIGVEGQAASPDGAGGYFINTSTSGGYVVEGQSSTGVVFSVNNSGDGYFSGTVSCSGCKTEMDDPADPANKYLYHSFVQSPDMMNVYNGNITTNGNGVATVKLPNYFESLNRDFRYQLTVIGQFAQAIVAQEISQNQFTIKTSQPNVKVSWQVTGVRQDPWANAHRVPDEVEKPADKRGYYLHPELYGAGPDKNVRPGLVTADAKTRIPSRPQPRTVTRPAPKAPPVPPAMRGSLATQVRPTPASATSQKLQSTP